MTITKPTGLVHLFDHCLSTDYYIKYHPSANTVIHCNNIVSRRIIQGKWTIYCKDWTEAKHVILYCKSSGAHDIITTDTTNVTTKDAIASNSVTTNTTTTTATFATTANNSVNTCITNSNITINSVTFTTNNIGTIISSNITNNNTLTNKRNSVMTSRNNVTLVIHQVKSGEIQELLPWIQHVKICIQVLSIKRGEKMDSIVPITPYIQGIAVHYDMIHLLPKSLLNSIQIFQIKRSRKWTLEQKKTIIMEPIQSCFQSSGIFGALQKYILYIANIQFNKCLDIMLQPLQYCKHLQLKMIRLPRLTSLVKQTWLQRMAHVTTIVIKGVLFDAEYRVFFLTCLPCLRQYSELNNIKAIYNDDLLQALQRTEARVHLSLGPFSDLNNIREYLTCNSVYTLQFAYHVDTMDLNVHEIKQSIKQWVQNGNRNLEEFMCYHENQELNINLSLSTIV
jgi:hypothetical protein